MLNAEIAKYFPNIIHDLNSFPKITKQKTRVCLLVSLEDTRQLYRQLARPKSQSHQQYQIGAQSRAVYETILPVHYIIIYDENITLFPVQK